MTTVANLKRVKGRTQMIYQASKAKFDDCGKKRVWRTANVLPKKGPLCVWVHLNCAMALRRTGLRINLPLDVGSAVVSTMPDPNIGMQVGRPWEAQRSMLLLEYFSHLPVRRICQVGRRTGVPHAQQPMGCFFVAMSPTFTTCFLHAE